MRDIEYFEDAAFKAALAALPGVISMMPIEAAGAIAERALDIGEAVASDAAQRWKDNPTAAEALKSSGDREEEKKRRRLGGRS